MDEAILLGLIFVAALLYSCVGHAGASGYTAILLMHGFAPESIRPAVFVMNICVASVTTYRFVRAGFFDWNFFWPLAVASTPFAFLGSQFKVSAQVLYVILGFILFASALRLLIEFKEKEGESTKPVMPALLLVGGLLGLLAGLSGTGGGIFLTPVLIISGWRKAKEAAAISAAFILANSVAGLFGHAATLGVHFESVTWMWLVAALLGGVVGSEIGSRRLTPWWLKKVMAVVLIIAAYHLVTTKPKSKPKDDSSGNSTAQASPPAKVGYLIY